MLRQIAADVQHQQDTLRERFLSARPFRHLVIDRFLVPQYCRQLISEFPGFDQEHALNEFGEVGRKAVYQNFAQLGPAYSQFDRLLRSGEFRTLISAITGIPNLLYDPEYVGGGTHENLSGQDLDPHVDFNYHPGTKLHRRLNLILFLNPRWKPEWGGSLELHRNPWLPPEENEITTILPLENRCVLFETTEHSWHGFTKIQFPEEEKKLSRRSIAVYFYTKDRPREEIAPDHSTIYVQRPLPEHIRAGYTLGEEDVQSVRDLLTRRDRQIQFLYQRESRFSSTLTSVLHSPTFRLAAFLSWPARKLWRLVKPAER